MQEKKVSVNLRKKPISDKDGKKMLSLYLDFYPPIMNLKTGGATRREFLRLYIYKEPTKKDGYKLSTVEKKHNKQQIEIASDIRAKREREVRNKDIYNQFEIEQQQKLKAKDMDFLDYFAKASNSQVGRSRGSWTSTMTFLKRYSKSIKFRDLNQSFVNGFKDFLLNANNTKNTNSAAKLRNNTALLYFNIFRQVLSNAHKEGFLELDPSANVKPIKKEETEKIPLTKEELKRLIDTPCKDELYKNAALFSAFTGLRISDIVKLKWSEVGRNKDGYILNIRQKKTKGLLREHPISDKAYSFTGGNKNPKTMPQEQQVFAGLEYSSYRNLFLYRWIASAGITKEIKLHNFRHTYAYLMLDAKVPIQVVSKLMGHKSLSTTMVYVKVFEQEKRAAVNAINLDI